MTTPDPGRVLVTGATGLLGSNVTTALLASGTEVTALVRSAERARRLLPEDERLRIVEGDITRVDSLCPSAPRGARGHGDGRRRGPGTVRPAPPPQPGGHPCGHPRPAPESGWYVVGDGWVVGFVDSGDGEGVEGSL
jgi:hypothetical protein